MNTHTGRFAVTAILVVVLFAARLHAQDPVESARGLYAAARYEEALQVLDALAASNVAPAERQSIELYRTLCLLAVGRDADADRAIEAIIAHNPSYQPAGDLSPRLRTAFSEARKRMLPSIVQQQYAEAKSAFDRKEFEAAAQAFQRTLDLLNDPDIQQAVQQPPLSDLRTLAAGFHDLSVKAIPPPPPPAPPPAPEPLPPPPPKIYSGDEAGIRQPVTIQQEMPDYRAVVPVTGLSGALEIVISERGDVESAVMISSVSPAYDARLIEAARQWRFQPATVNGEPVKFRKRIQIRIAPPR